MNALQLLLLCLVGWLNRNQQQVIEYLQEEVKVLKELLGKPPRFHNTQRCRLAAKAQRLGREQLHRFASLVRPQTLLDWHRRLIARKYDGSKVRTPGRLVTPDAIKELILKLARENRAWGYTRIQGALQNLGHKVGRGTIAKVLKEAGIDPAPERQQQTTWKEFLRQHWDVLTATDFFTVEVWTALGLVRYHVLFVIRLATRQVHIAGIIAEPQDSWMRQMARNVSDGWEGFLLGCRYLIHDRSSLFSSAFTCILESAGIECVKLPPHSPNLNAIAERFVRTIKESCLDRLILFGEVSLHRALAEFLVHYHRERNHQGMGNKILHPEVAPWPTEGSIHCRKRLGGLLCYYYREAA